MLKPEPSAARLGVWGQPPSGGCVLKLWLYRKYGNNKTQPPSGGCVLKH
ncbi:hypothetical protein NEISICOT_02636 [Neisseria sicca ATCC 29256]|uniref:Uncharacterized protein n=1 Tax=Neisseria sicca ATCC 29256 TaxID=547045 RepID=C6M7X1_NEISI|nr:hypothetical protein NEISICOT_02636 [Neisseria sicca ATCC 29256]